MVQHSGVACVCWLRRQCLSSGCRRCLCDSLLCGHQLCLLHAKDAGGGSWCSDGV
jgi:hypothetical protein